jgi:pilus assembly protein CpaF
MTASEMQDLVFSEIDDPKNGIYLKVQKKQLDRVGYLNDIRERCKKEKIDEEETEDIVYLVDKALWGFGILDGLIHDENISDIRLTNENNIRIKRNGKRLPTSVRFGSRLDYERYIEFITNRNNTNISVANAAQVFTDKDGCSTDILRFSLVSQLVNSGDRPTLLIRKIPKKKRGWQYLIDQGYCTKEQAEYLIDRWKNGHGMLVCGPNGSGKTTLTNMILESTPHDRSCDVIQESEELFCHTHPEMIFRKIMPNRPGSSIHYALKDLARLALMESFDIIVIGEIKGDEAAELSYAAYTGSQTMTTVHSISARDGYEKIIDYALDAQPNRTREHFAKQFVTMDTVVYVKNFHIDEIMELNKEHYDRVTGSYELNYADTSRFRDCDESVKVDEILSEYDIFGNRSAKKEEAPAQESAKETETVEEQAKEQVDEQQAEEISDLWDPKEG